MIKVDISGIQHFLPEDAITNLDKEGNEAFDALLNGTRPGNDFIGWVNYPKEYVKADVERILKSAKKIQANSKVFLVLGIGGSFLGAKAAIDVLKSPEYNLLEKDTPDIFFLGNGASGAQVERIIKIIGNRDFSLCVISKSGSTAETGSAFRIFRDMIFDRYGDEANDRIIAITDAKSGFLRATATKMNWETYDLPSNIGGRYSVLTAVGLLPMAVAGIDIQAVLDGAECEMDEILAEKGGQALVYAKARQALYRNGKYLEVLSSFEPAQRFIGEWWKQLYAESEGKDGKGIFTVSCTMTTDLHSLGQMIQDGERNLFETILYMPEASSLSIPEGEGYNDGLDWLGGKTYNRFNEAVAEATKKAHMSGNVPIINLYPGDVCEKSFGALIYFFEFGCGLSGYISGVNPFNQPGVEEYKKNMKSILGK